MNGNTDLAASIGHKNEDSYISFSLEDLITCLKRKKMSAGRLDSITFEMLKKLPVETKSLLVNELQNIFNNNFVPEEWRTVKIVPIPKPNKDLSHLNNYRPISLLSVMAKSLNMMIKDKLMTLAERNKKFPDSCFAYRKGKSASMCINECLYWSSRFKKEGYKVVMCVLDITNAYDCVNVGLLSVTLTHLGVNNRIVNWIVHFFSKRWLVLGNSRVLIENGLPQDSCLSPILFNLYTAKLHRLKDNKTKMFQYADDFAFMCIGKNEDGGLEPKIDINFYKSFIRSRARKHHVC